VVASKHNRNRSFFERGAHELVESIADPRNLFDEFFLGIAVFPGFGNRSRKIASVDHWAAEPGDLVADPSDPESRRPHIDATPAPAHIERDADDMDRWRHNSTIQG
jgi:hypothetical protein